MRPVFMRSTAPNNLSKANPVHMYCSAVSPPVASRHQHTLCSQYMRQYQIENGTATFSTSLWMDQFYTYNPTTVPLTYVAASLMEIYISVSIEVE